MAQGRGSAVGVGAAMACLLLLQYTDMVRAAVFTVGDDHGWTFNVESWPNQKLFRAGDTLVFNYSPGSHNVVGVNSVGYNQCMAPRGSKVLESGKDQMKLVKGQNFFICTVPGHCQAGMRIAINAA
ncbi:basic blue protein-like [Cucurbita moschata]|uniref:Basic blue protein n=1 Tax=Cucurbita moschata TaxID=3662 RepID=A0A6J1E8N9_CUCMO|nr:basic blue protein-like [Cucurbita moschata]